MAVITRRRWCFLLDDYEEKDYAQVGVFLSTQIYGVVAKGYFYGSLRLRGFVILVSPQDRSYFTERMPPNVKYVSRRGPGEMFSIICKKHGPWEEFGEIPLGDLYVRDLSFLREWVVQHPRKPTDGEIAQVGIVHPRITEYVDYLWEGAQVQEQESGFYEAREYPYDEPPATASIQNV
jgi:hypothetical protein